MVRPVLQDSGPGFAAGMLNEVAPAGIDSLA